MNKIETTILNPRAVYEASQMMCFTARLTQRGHKIKYMGDLKDLYNDYDRWESKSRKLCGSLVKLPHPTIQKFALINVAVIGASRRFLAQITRHQNEVKFMSASLQYSDYSDKADFCVPYELIDTLKEEDYIKAQTKALKAYTEATSFVGHDAAGYLMPEGMRNILIISATPYQWKHMISQRTCRRNTTEMRYVMLQIWRQLYELDPVLFGPDVTGPFCQRGKCQEGKMCCGKAIAKEKTPEQIIKEDFPKLKGENK